MLTDLIETGKQSGVNLALAALQMIGYKLVYIGKGWKRLYDRLMNGKIVNSFKFSTSVSHK